MGCRILQPYFSENTQNFCDFHLLCQSNDQLFDKQIFNPTKSKTEITLNISNNLGTLNAPFLLCFNLFSTKVPLL